MSRRHDRRLPHAADALDRLRLGSHPIVGLDFDGTLAPIAATPGEARLPEDTRTVLRRLSSVVTVVILSGRDAQDVRARIGVPVAAYAGSHGFDITDGRGDPFEDGPAARFAPVLPVLDHAEARLRDRFDGAAGVIVERKRFGAAVHFRGAPQRAREVRAAVRAIAAEHPDVTVLEGKAVAEIRPEADWNKGRALDWLADRLGPPSGIVFIGDDTTDEDVFRAIAGRGVGILVADRPRATAASLRVSDPAEVAAFLERLAARYEGDG